MSWPLKKDLCVLPGQNSPDLSLENFETASQGSENSREMQKENPFEENAENSLQIYNPDQNPFEDPPPGAGHSHESVLFAHSPFLPTIFAREKINSPSQGKGQNALVLPALPMNISLPNRTTGPPLELVFNRPPLQLIEENSQSSKPPRRPDPPIPGPLPGAPAPFHTPLGHLPQGPPRGGPWPPPPYPKIRLVENSQGTQNPLLPPSSAAQGGSHSAFEAWVEGARVRMQALKDAGTVVSRPPQALLASQGRSQSAENLFFSGNETDPQEKGVKGARGSSTGRVAPPPAVEHREKNVCSPLPHAGPAPPRPRHGSRGYLQFDVEIPEDPEEKMDLDTPIPLPLIEREFSNEMPPRQAFQCGQTKNGRTTLTKGFPRPRNDSKRFHSKLWLNARR